MFVTPDFEYLLEVLQKISSRLAWRKGGVYGVHQALKSKTLNTVELDSGLQISGVLEKKIQQKDHICFLKFSGPCQLSFQGRELPGQGKDYHKQGYSTPLGPITIKPKELREGQILNLKFPSEITLKGEMTGKTERKGRLLLITFKNCLIQRGQDTLYEPQWGPFDLAVGGSVVSVFSGPADEKSFDLEDTFKSSVIPQRNPSSEEKDRFKIYKAVFSLEQERDLKRNKKNSQTFSCNYKTKRHPCGWLFWNFCNKQKNFLKTNKRF